MGSESPNLWVSGFLSPSIIPDQGIGFRAVDSGARQTRNAHRQLGGRQSLALKFPMSLLAHELYFRSFGCRSTDFHTSGDHAFKKKCEVSGGRPHVRKRWLSDYAGGRTPRY